MCLDLARSSPITQSCPRHDVADPDFLDFRELSVSRILSGDLEERRLVFVESQCLGLRFRF
jgi:hypothetical protein